MQLRKRLPRPRRLGDTNSIADNAAAVRLIFVIISLFPGSRPQREE
jgi:hypothetical protein